MKGRRDVQPFPAPPEELSEVARKCWDQLGTAMVDWTPRDIPTLTTACRWYGIHAEAVKRSEGETEPGKRWAALTEAAMASKAFLAAIRLLGLPVKARQRVGADGKVWG